MTFFEGKLIALDVDGTILREDGTISARMAEAAEKAAEAGATLTLATGRDWNAVVSILAQLEAVSYALTINGIECFTRDGTELHAFELDAEIARDAIEAVRAGVPGCSIGIGINGELVGEEGIAPAFDLDIADIRYVPDVLDEVAAGLRDIIIYHPDLSQDLEMMFSLVEACLPSEGIQVAYTGLDMVELVPPGCGKHTGLDWLSTHLGIAQADVIAFGDGMNDLTMLGWAGTGVAMGHAVKDVRKAADEETLSNVEGGVAHWIEQRLPTD